ncbi:hypothetical protein B0H11DRAFT_2238103 [Mycena galericulata]|nr:hypothetical protein B0H11DRAFT_2238103 [Mycena galericulata]
MSDPSSMGPPSVDRTFILTWGVEFIAYTLDIALWGVAISMLLYFRKYTKKDSLAIRSAVALLAIFTTVHSLFLAIYNYKGFVSLFGNFEGQDVIVYEANVAVCSEFLVAFTAQMFYASRIWILSNQDWRYVAPVMLLAVLQLSAGIAQTVEVLISRETFREELRSRDGILSTFTMPTMQPNSTHNNLTDESIAHGVHVSTSVVKWVESIPADDSTMENHHAIKMSVRHTVV